MSVRPTTASSNTTVAEADEHRALFCVEVAEQLFVNFGDVLFMAIVSAGYAFGSPCAILSDSFGYDGDIFLSLVRGGMFIACKQTLFFQAP